MNHLAKFVSGGVLSGSIWFLAAGAVGSAVPIFGEMWLPHWICAIFTAFVVGTLLNGPIHQWKGWRWYALPLLSLGIATLLYGFLLPCAWLLVAWRHGGGVDAEAFYKTPLIFAFYSMTFYLVLFYPMALLTQCLMKSFYQKNTNMKTDAS